MTDKYIPASKLLALQQHNDLNPLYENGGDYILYDDLRALIDEAPEVDSEAIGQIVIIDSSEMPEIALQFYPEAYKKGLFTIGDKCYVQPKSLTALITAIESDAHAASFQSMAGYRKWLLDLAKGVGK